MTQTIWKFTIPVQDSQQIKVDGATVFGILDAQAHIDRPNLIDIWMIVEPHPDSVEFVPIEIRGTGHPLHEERIQGYGSSPRSTLAAHIATVRDGIFVWHVFRGAFPPVA
ncbi:hypothetical protein SEA_ARTI_68 [Gordonia phage Arti]|uniref:DUF7352 domain-containing protein n=1 Tax=Gordonia phage NatB6 TaxID=2250322 RepID=A0A345L4Z7_9CAUD|nr:hypothetical protein KNT99_gp69 [Gordonia phage NatB6]AXH50349.1 hypothetical protein SEA_NATB6_69 [Gordonia phage NatB6]WNM66109.1 hypothetical protein SEA_WHEEZY_69 [Gordonia phage Wheezy]WNM69323.1 hypothetical protein SEA_ARTI_68 [Gordonia phage Arti]